MIKYLGWNFDNSFAFHAHRFKQIKEKKGEENSRKSFLFTCEKISSKPTFHLIKALNSDWAVPTRLFTFNKRIGKSVIKGKRPKNLYLMKTLCRVKW